MTILCCGIMDLKTNLYIFFCTKVIGRGGEQINKIQQDSGCKVQIAHGQLHASAQSVNWKGFPNCPLIKMFLLVFADSAGLPERSVSLTGSPEAIG